MKKNEQIKEEPAKPKTLSDIDTVELKALIFDEQRRLQVMQQELSRRESQL